MYTQTQLSLPSYRAHALRANTLFQTTGVFRYRAILIWGDGGMAGGLLLERTGLLTHSHSHAIKGPYANLLRLSIGPSSRLHTSKRYERRNQFLTGRERLTFLRSDAVNWLRFG